MKTARVYRMVMDDHTCPYGIKTVDLLKRQGFKVEDNHLTSRSETDAFKEEHGVETTPQTFIDDKRIGGYDDVREYFGKSRSQPEEGETSYQPVIAIFAVALLLALGLSWAFFDDLFTVRAAEWFSWQRSSACFGPWISTCGRIGRIEDHGPSWRCCRRS